MEFSFSARPEELRRELESFMDEHVYPAETVFAEEAATLEHPGIPRSHFPKMIKVAASVADGVAEQQAVAHG